MLTVKWKIIVRIAGTIAEDYSAHYVGLYLVITIPRGLIIWFNYLDTQAPFPYIYWSNAAIC